MSRFSWLKDKKEYASFAEECIKADNYLDDDPNTAVMVSRTALEKALEWVYTHDPKLNRNLLQIREGKLKALLDDQAFKAVLNDSWMCKRLNFIRKNGNTVLHGNGRLSKEYAKNTVKTLYDFVKWIDQKYGAHQEKSSEEGSFWGLAGMAILAGIGAWLCHSKDN